MGFCKLWLNQANQQFELYGPDGKIIPGQTKTIINDGWEENQKEGPPRATVTLIVELVNEQPKTSVYDPT